MTPETPITTTVDPETEMLPAGQQWLNTVLRLRSDLKLEPRTEGGQRFVMIEDPVRARFFRIGEAELRWIMALDGHQTAGQLLAEMSTAKPSDGESSRADGERILAWLLQHNLASPVGWDNVDRLSRQAEQLSERQERQWWNPIAIRIPLFRPDALLEFIEPRVGWLFSRWFLVFWFLLGAIATVTLIQRWDSMPDQAADILSPDRWIWLWLTWIGLKVVHEIAHGVACRRYGGEVPEAGILLLLLTPMAYVNVTSMWRFRRRRDRMVVAAAGILVELMIGFVAVLVWSQQDGQVASIAMNVWLMAGVSTVLFNANPLMRFDGYYLLSDALAIPNLYSRSTQWFGGWIRRFVFGTKAPGDRLTVRERWWFPVYGSLATLWRILISLSLILVASTMLQGAGLVLSIAGVMAWWGWPLLGQVRRMLGPESTDPPQPGWTVASLLVISTIGFSLLGMVTAPATRSAPAVVDYADATVIRAPGDGFIVELQVGDGSPVTAGQVLLRLENPELEDEVVDLEHELRQATIRATVAREQRDFSLAQVQQTRVQRLREQVDEKRAQVDELTIKAPSDGWILARSLQDRSHEFVRQGDRLVTLVESNQRELVASIDQADFDATRWSPGRGVRMLLPGHALQQGQLASVNPRASYSSEPASLSAAQGGPIPVRTAANGEEAGKWLSPRFTVTVALPTDLPGVPWVGQRGRIFFQTTERSLGSDLLHRASAWWKQQISAGASF